MARHGALPALGPVLVTGAGGFIGGRLCERLVLEGVRVRALVRRADQAARLAARGIEPVPGDLTRPDDLPPAVRGCGVIFHCGAWMGEPWTWEAARAANVEGTRSLLDASLRAGASRFVHVSSISVYGPTAADPIDEQTPLWPLGPYRATKIGAEQEVASAHGRGLPTVILRPGQVFGPGDVRLSGLVLRWLRRGLPLVVEGGRGFCYPIYIDNLVDALLASATTADAVGGIFNLADADVRWGEFLGSYARMAGRRMRSMPAWVVRGATLGMETVGILTGRPARGHRADMGYFLRRSRYSTARASAVLGWHPRVPLAEAITATAAWLQQAGLLDRRNISV